MARIFRIHLDECNIEYELISNPVVDDWREMICALKPEDLEFPHMAIHNPGMSEWMLDRLEHMIWYLKNIGYEINGEYNPDDPVESLNRLHEHFVTKHEHREKGEVKKILREYNLTIHWLEAWLAEKRTPNYTSTRINFFFLPSLVTNKKLPEEGFDLWEDWIDYGDLCIQYPQRGKHFTEILLAQDKNIPQEHIVPFEQYAAHCNAQFSIFPQSKEEMQNKLREQSKWVLELYDWERVTLGWPKLAKLKSIDGKVEDCKKIIGWE